MAAERTVRTRMGDGALVEMAPGALRADVEAAVEAASLRAGVPPLEQDEMDHIVDIYATNAAFVAVDLGDQVVLSNDCSSTFSIGHRVDELRVWQNHLAADLVELGHPDYSYKPVKAVLDFERQAMAQAQADLVVPVQYGAMPNLGLYSQPDGPCGNWAELLPQGQIDAAREAQEEAVVLAVEDIVRVADTMRAAGADGIDIDSVGAAGDGDFLAALCATERIRARHPGVGIQIGMAGEFVLGMHGELEHHGVRLAGLWPEAQMRLVSAAGASIYGPAINVNTGKSCAWNVAYAITLTKPCCHESPIPVHMNLGMGVGGVPMAVNPPIDAVSRASKACVEILRLDGI